MLKLKTSLIVLGAVALVTVGYLVYKNKEALNNNNDSN